MVTTASIARVAALIGDPTRASMLQALMEGRALTAAELAGVARVAPQTASGHLAQLTTAGLVTVARQGRHRYHRLATPLVARMLSSYRRTKWTPAQGSRMSLACDDLEHVGVVPGSLLAPATEAGLGAPVSGDQVESDLAQESEVARRRPVAHAAVIFAEGDVQHPMQRVLNAPVPADRPDQDGGIIVAACQEVADLGLDRAGAVDAPDRLDGQNRPQVRPAVQGLEVLDRRGHEDAPTDQATVALVKGVEHGSPLASSAQAGALELLAHSPKGAAVIGLKHQKIVGALGPDLRSDVLLAAHRIQRHDAALQVQGLQQLRDRRDLVRLAVDRALAQRQSLFAGPGADHVQRPKIVAAAARAPDGFAVHSDYFTLEPTRPGLHPLGEAPLEGVRVDQHEHPPEGVVRGDAIRQSQEGRQPGLLAAPIERDVLPALGAGDHRTDGDHQDVDELMIAPARLARILQPCTARG